jgi:hypothetical protein
MRIIGSNGGVKLAPDNYDIKELVSVLQNIEDLLYPTGKKERPLITYDIEEGSVRNIFKTSIQAIIGFSAVITQIEKIHSIDFLELKTAQAVENIQNLDNSYLLNLINNTSDELYKIINLS